MLGLDVSLLAVAGVPSMNGFVNRFVLMVMCVCSSFVAATWLG